MCKSLGAACRLGLAVAIGLVAADRDTAAAQAGTPLNATATTQSKPATPTAQPAGGSTAGAPKRPAGATPKRPADAAKPTPAAKPGPSGPRAFRFAGFFQAGYQGFAAKEAFEATLGSSGGTVWGAGGSVTHRSGLFGQVDITRFKADGERVFVFGGDVFPLGIPLTVEVMPIELTVGYKFFTRPPRPKPVKPAAPATPVPPKGPKDALGLGERWQTTPARPVPAARPAAPPRQSWGGVKPYVGGGFGWVGYKESSDFSASGEDTDDRFTSFHVLGGFEVPIWKWIGAAGEFNYRWVGGAFGEAGVSKEFGEDDLGGASFRVKLTVGF